MNANDGNQVSLGHVAGRLAASPAGLPGLATASLLLALFVPVASIGMDARGALGGAMQMFGGSSGGTINGLHYVGWVGFIPVLAFAAATASRVVPAIASYRKLLDQLAFLSIGVILVWAVFGGAVGSELRAARSQTEMLLGSQTANELRFVLLPAWGAIFVILPPILLLVARMRENPRTTGTAPGLPASRRLRWPSRWETAAIVAGLIAAVFASFIVTALVIFAFEGGMFVPFVMSLAVLILIAVGAAFAFRAIVTAKLSKPVGMQSVATGTAAVGFLLAGFETGFILAHGVSRGYYSPLLAILLVAFFFLVAGVAAIACRRSLRRSEPRPQVSPV